MEGLGIELILFSRGEKHYFYHSHAPKYPTLIARREMLKHGIGYPLRDPHPAPRNVLLKATSSSAHRPRFPHPEPGLAGKALALPHPQCYPVPRPDEPGQVLAIPGAGSHSHIQWRVAKGFPDLTVTFIPETGRPSLSPQANKPG